MRLEDIDFYKLLPEFMKFDKYNQLWAQSASNLFQKLSEDSRRLIIVGQTDYLNEAELDQLAQDSDIFWYQYFAPIEVKRQTIKDAPLVFSRLGTVWAVERVMNEYFENTELQEWFEYDGEPHHFKLKTSDVNIFYSDIQAFLSILDKVKRKSQWLDSIVIILRSTLSVNSGVGWIFKRTSTFDCTQRF